MRIAEPQSAVVVRAVAMTSKNFDVARTYARTHPWIAFKLDLNCLDHRTWMLLGEAGSKCEHGWRRTAPARCRGADAPDLLEQRCSRTTTIEGDTLSEDERLALVRDELHLPPSREYLGITSKNIVEACNASCGTFMKVSTRP